MSADAHLTAGVTTAPKKVGLYDPANEKDACGIGFIADLTRTPTRSTVVVRAPLLPRRCRSAAAATAAVSACRPRASLAHQAFEPLVHAARRGAARAASSLVLKSAELAHRMRLRQDALEMLSRMEHRGACGCEIDTGDGAGAIFTLPHYSLMFMRGGPTRPSRPRR